MRDKNLFGADTQVRKITFYVIAISNDGVAVPVQIPGERKQEAMSGAVQRMPNPGPEHKGLAAQPCNEVRNSESKLAINALDYRVIVFVPQSRNQPRCNAGVSNIHAGEILASEVSPPGSMFLEPVLFPA